MDFLHQIIDYGVLGLLLCLSVIALALALALKATAMGLLVAIPAVTLYNLLLRRCKVLLMQWDIRHGREGI